MAHSESTPDFLTIALIRKAQGRRGEVAADILTDFPDLFAQRTRVFLLTSKGQRREAELEDHWFHKSGIVLKFRGIATIESAGALAGCEVQIPASEAASLQADQFYVHNLAGCIVLDLSSGRTAGVVTGVISDTGSAPLLVVQDEQQPGVEHMIPFAAEYLPQIDVAEKVIRMRLPAGMLDINLPGYRDGLTGEESPPSADPAGKPGDKGGGGS